VLKQYNKEMEINSKKIFLYIAAAAAIIAAAYVLYLLSDIVIIVVVSILISFIFNPVINFLERGKINRLFSTLIVFISFLLVVYLVLSFIIPKFVLQMNQLIESMRDYSIHDEIVKMESDIHKLLPFFSPGRNCSKDRDIHYSSVV
jgi:predicted PurR-regulated permease PerM